jgi:alpha-tubulin suppressor-like RCC1 family protein
MRHSSRLCLALFNLSAIGVFAVLTIACSSPKASEGNSPSTDGGSEKEVDSGQDGGAGDAGGDGGPGTAGKAKALFAKYSRSCVLLLNGTVECWGQGDLGDGTTSSSFSPVALSLTNITDIAVGSGHTCALSSAGTVECWGSNQYGQLGSTTGIGSLVGSATPETVAGLSGVQAVVAGTGHTCALLTGGAVSCWGSNADGVLGNGSTTPLNSTAPLAVPGLSGVTSLVAGAAYNCALLASGAVECWGNGANGQLGTGAMAMATAPTAVSGLTSVMAVSAGDAHACALLSDGTVQCWGNNKNGQLGNGNTTQYATPVAVTGLTGATAIAAGGTHTCALVSGGAVKCWGNNQNGQLGSGDQTSSSTPVEVAGLTSAMAVVAGEAHSCAMLSDGSVVCWGDNVSGQIANGTTTPITVSGLTGAVAIAAGGNHTCAALSNGTTQCWGDNLTGDLGNGSTTPSFAPVAAVGPTGVTDVSAGPDYTCVTASGGTTQCWGNNILNQLGNPAVFEGGLDSYTTPVAVPGLTGATAVAAGYSHTCALVSGGTVECWSDDNSQGQLGNGTTMLSRTPVQVSALTTATAIASGQTEDYTCALLAGGTVDCWGGNQYGTLGNGSTASSSTPVPVSSLTGVLAIAAGNTHSCALLTGGGVDCWGDNFSAGTDFGLGNGTHTQYSIPVAVSGITSAIAIAAGGLHSCALLMGGTAECWGANDDGQLGSGGLTASTTPVAVVGLTGGIAIAAGLNHTCALLADGTVKCWGDNSYGQLANGATTPVPVSGL